MSRSKLETKKKLSITIQSDLNSKPQSRVFTKTTSPISEIKRMLMTKEFTKANAQIPGKVKIGASKILPKNSSSSQAGGDNPRPKETPKKNRVQETEYLRKLQVFAKIGSRSTSGKKKIARKIFKNVALVASETTEKPKADCFPPIPPIAILSAGASFAIPTHCRAQTPKKPRDERKRKIEEIFLSKSSFANAKEFKTVDANCAPSQSPAATTNKRISKKIIAKSDNNAKRATATKKCGPTKSFVKKNTCEEQTRKVREKKEELKDRYSPRVREIWRSKLSPSGRRSPGRGSARSAKRNQPQKEIVQETSREGVADEILTQAHRMIWSWFFNGLVPSGSHNPKNSVSNETKKLL